MKFSSIKYLFLVISIFSLGLSCKFDQTLQEYFVLNQEASNFVVYDIPMSLVSSNNINFTGDQKEAFESIEKLNILGYRLEENNLNQFEIELHNIHEILNKEPFEELLRAGNNNDGKIILKYLGNNDAIDELIIFGRINTKGFIIIRVLGENMNPNKVLTLGNLINQLDFGQVPVNEVMKFF